MSLHALRLIRELLSQLHPAWERDEEFQKNLYSELMDELGLFHAPGSYAECEALEEELKRLGKTPEGRKKLREIILRVLARRFRKKTGEGEEEREEKEKKVAVAVA